MDKLTGFLNFIHESRIEYKSIFPTNESVLQHLLYVNGNGFEVINGDLIDDNNKSIFKCKYSNHWLSRPFLDDLNTDCLVQNIKYMVNENSKKYSFEVFPRPYPLCEYAKIYHIDKTFPLFFIKICNNLNYAWKTILEEEIHNNHFDQKISWESRKPTLENYHYIQALCDKFDYMIKNWE